jgi:hypothetical protein
MSSEHMVKLADKSALVSGAYVRWMLEAKMNPFCCLILGLFCFSCFASESVKTENSDQYLSELLLLDASLLNQSKTNQQKVATNLAVLIKNADQALTMQSVNVTQNETVAVSGDPHDYFSVGPYWWPDPSKKNGLPWINRDGQVNQTMRGPDSDAKLFQQLMRAIRVLGLAYYFTEQQKYAAKAQQLLQVWFIDPDTKMSPHLNYAQSIPGRVHGRGIGIIDWRLMPHLLDTLTLISPQTDTLFEDDMQQWLTIFLGWMIESKNGQDEAAMKNNHGTFYDVILASLAIHLKFDDLAKNIFANSKKRITSQIKKDGRQPHELKRTKPFHYSAFNLLAFTQLAQMATKLDINLWDYPSKKDQRVYRAYRFMLENIDSSQFWPGSQEKYLPFDKLVGTGFRIQAAMADNQILQMISNWTDKAKQQGTQCGLLFNHNLLLEQSGPVSFSPCNY